MNKSLLKKKSLEEYHAYKKTKMMKKMSGGKDFLVQPRHIYDISQLNLSKEFNFVPERQISTVQNSQFAIPYYKK